MRGTGGGPPRAVVFGGRRFSLGSRTYVLGILNVTPDSFFDGGRFRDPSRALDRALALQAEGAAGIDVGGESTRPGAASVDEAEELRRVIPVIRRLASSLKIPVSIDSRKPRVQAAALEAGAGILNDVSGGRNPETLELAASSGATLVLMHMRGEPGTMQKQPSYKNPLREVRGFLARRRAAALEAGVRPERLILDPGIGFGKSLAHNLALLSGIPLLRKLGSAVMIGASRKSWLKALTGREAPDRLAGSLAAAALAARDGADFVRVHDVAGSLDAVRVGRAWS